MFAPFPRVANVELQNRQGWLLAGNPIRNGGCATAGTWASPLNTVCTSGVMTRSFSDDIRLHGDWARGSVEFVAR